MKPFTRHIVAMAAVLSLAGLSAVPAYAEDVFGESTNYLLNLHVSLIELMRIILAVAGVITIFTIALRVMKGDKESAEKMLYYVVYIAIGFVLLTVMNHLPWNSVHVGNPSGDFGDIRASLANLMLAILSLVMIISLTVSTIYAIRGDKESLKKFLNWLEGSFVGFIIIDIIGNLGS